MCGRSGDGVACGDGGGLGMICFRKSFGGGEVQSKNFEKILRAERIK